MPRRWQRALALVSALCLVSGAFVQAPRGCTVCPVDCPMHSAHPNGLGCHRVAPAARDAGAAPTTQCAVRATCGHVEHGVTASPGVPPSCNAVVVLQRVRAARLEEPRAPDGMAPEPAGHPPEFLRV